MRNFCTCRFVAEDAMKIGFTLDSLNSPDPFANTTTVPDAVKEAIRLGVSLGSCNSSGASVLRLQVVRRTLGRGSYP